MAEASAEKIAQLAFDAGVLDERQVQEAWAHFGRRNIPGHELLQFLLRREYLTNWQVDRLLQEQRHGYFCSHYKLLYIAGAGTFSRVYRAAHRETGKMAAVKVLRRRFSDDEVQTDQFLREGKLGKLLQHPCIVPTWEVGQFERMYFIAMEFIEGQNLKEFIKLRKKIEPLEATRIMIGLASGLAYAFEKGVTHRDLKLTNVLISSQGAPKLVDFGLAAQESKRTADEENYNPRTVDYVGLERASGVKRDDTRSDIFFAGCILYHMLTGTAPLSETRDRVERLAKSRFTDVVPIHRADPNVPKGIASVVQRAMELTASLRYQTPAEMLAELQLVHKRMLEGSGEAHETGGHDAQALFAMWGEQVQRTLIIAESNLQMQEVLREGLKKAGYRVLLTRDPHRALTRFDEKDPPDGAVFSSLELGEPALEAFNRFADQESAAARPAVLLISETHRDWVERAKAGPNRLVLVAPKLRELRTTLQKLLPPAQVGAAPSANAAKT
jgi:serine/threonine protein kinase